MRRNQFLSFCAIGFVGCFLGGFVAQAGPRPVLAQYQTFPNNQPVNGQVQIRSENTLFVPEGGLRMVNQQNRTLGVILDLGGNGGIVLFNNQGRPSVTLSAGGAGTIEANAQSGPILRVTNPAGTEGVSLSGADGAVGLKVGQGVTVTSGKDGGRIVVNNSKGKASLQMENSASGGHFTGTDHAGSSMFELRAVADSGQLRLFKKDSEPGFEASGTGTATIKQAKEVLWKIPTDGTSSTSR